MRSIVVYLHSYFVAKCSIVVRALDLDLAPPGGGFRGWPQNVELEVVSDQAFALLFARKCEFHQLVETVVYGPIELFWKRILGVYQQA